MEFSPYAGLSAAPRRDDGRVPAKVLSSDPRSFVSRENRSVKYGVGLLVVMVMLAGAVLFNKKSGERSRAQEDTREAIKRVEAALRSYHRDCGGFPSQAESYRGLTAKTKCKGWKGPYLEETHLRDGWGHELGYRFDDVHPEIFSLGADGREGGTGLDTDVSSAVGDRGP